MSDMKKPTFSISVFGQKPDRRQKRQGRLRKRKPKRQGSRDQRGKILPERQRIRCFWCSQPCRAKEG